MPSAHADTTITYSPSWTLIPTHYCRNTCGYCVFVERTGEAAQLTSLQTAHVEIKRARQAGATELLIMSGEGIHQSRAVRNALRHDGFSTYINYLVSVARIALEHDILPHINIGNVTEAEVRALRQVVPSMGMMMESIDDDLRTKEAHRHAPDKEVARRLATLHAAGRACMPFTTGILIGIGESTESREASLRAIAEIQQTYGHIQEVIMQPFTPHPGIAMADHPPPNLAEMLDAVSLARTILPKEVAVQVPPNIAPQVVALVEAGASDLGGISPDGDRINPAERWLAPQTYDAALQPHGFTLRPRLAVHDSWISPHWLSPETLQATVRVRRRLPGSQAQFSLPAFTSEQVDSVIHVRH
ncbi:MAG: 7,8-didemethyl-8-hydroxy-5-deazariboflavin synthase subunit CofG [Pyrinomonadaceae bacterium]|nr:7,8-didemethyl-8-hydroxy-5-deazariboflavin synthase subunit CofG [Pyrinomonadaceae bacterium]